jgi:signal transduction histidine kinase
VDNDQLSELAQLAEFPEKNPGPVGKLARDATIQMANAAARTFLGRDDVLGRCWVDLCPGMNWDIWQSVLDSPVTGEPVNHEAEADGPRCVLFTHVLSDNAETVFVYGADITARRQQELVAAEQAERLSQMARFPEMNPGPVLRTDREGNLLLANAAARAVFGDELLGRRWPDLCPGIDEGLWDAILASEEIVSHETRIGEFSYVFAHRFDPPTDLVFVFGADVTWQKRAERALAQSERMATLGTLAAGVAHELNNPAAATRRAAEQLREAFSALDLARGHLAEIPDEGVPVLAELDEVSERRAVTPSNLGSVQRSDLEAEIEDWLDDHDVADAWDLAPGLVAQELTSDDLDRLLTVFGEERLPLVLAWSVHTFRVRQLTHEIGEGSARISEIVGALKTYSYLGQAPVQAVDVHEALDSTLVIMRNKLKTGIDVVRDYCPDLPPVAAYGSELNQVWTNLLDNAADAIYSQSEPKGTVTIRTRSDGDRAIIELEDDGPGIAEEIQRHLFDPFFTTKGPGKGTGLGLSTTYSIITEKHHGTIAVDSRPGRTVFTVTLPFDTTRPS